MSRVVVAAVAAVAVAAGAQGWRWFGRHTRTQVHRINQ